MRGGSVIVDLAAPTGGNCVYTEPNRAVLSPNGVTIVGVAWLVLDGHGMSWLACRYQCYVEHTLWLFNIAMENGPFIDGLPVKHGDFPWPC
jgi:hypothetical protein